MPAVSVLMVYHRVTPFLGPAVQSVLAQTFPDLELVLVDNGTGAGVAPLGELGFDPRVRLVASPSNVGISRGHNLGLSHARGEYIALLDYDDIALPHRMARQVEALRADPRLGLVCSRAAAIDEAGVVMRPEFSLLGGKDQYVYSAYTTPAVTPTYTGRREVFERFPYRPEFPCAADYDFLSRVAEVCPLGGIPEVLLHYRHHAGQTTWQHASAQILNACMIRLVTARRRQGRAEDLAGVVAGVGSWLREPPPPARAYARFAGWSLREGFAVLAVYHARKLLAVRRDLRAGARAVWVLGSALRMAPREAALLLRLFFTGPVRAHGLKPA
jgi:glycosyltransferase involved in cell wall biosynthesis